MHPAPAIPRSIQIKDPDIIRSVIAMQPDYPATKPGKLKPLSAVAGILILDSIHRRTLDRKAGRNDRD